MNILIHIGHPAHVHFFKNIIFALKEHGHEVRIITRKKDITLQLLDAYGFEYTTFNFFSTSLAGKIIDLAKTDFLVSRIALDFRPDIMIGIGLPSITHVGWFMQIPSIFITDTEDAKLANNLAKPFATVMCTPACFTLDFGEKHVRFNGFKELASLDPRYFTPDPSVPEELGIKQGEPYIVVRRISYDAHHDIGLKGIKKEDEFFNQLEKYGRILVSSEKSAYSTPSKYDYTLAPEKFHSLLAFASLYIGEGGTTAAEAAMIGVPSIHIESTSEGTATGELSGNFKELRDTYGLLYYYASMEEAIKKGIEILKNPQSKSEWQQKKDRFIADKIDVAAWFTDFIERYPESFSEYKKDTLVSK
jgi:uncharacterized protein